MATESNTNNIRAAAFAPQMPADRPGYEIWFTVLHDPVERIALWLRYTRYIPKGSDRPAQAILWASLFAANDAARHTFSSRSFPLDQAKFANDRIEIGDEAVLGADYMVGETKTPRGKLRWDLEIHHNFEPYTHGPERLAKVGRTHSVVVSPFARARGTLRLGNAKALRLKDAPLMFTHIWGTERVPELYWCYLPFAASREPAEIQALEAVYVKPSALTPPVCFATALSSDGRLLHDHSLTRGVFGGNRFEFPEQNFRLNFEGRRVEVRARMNREQQTGYIYRNPDNTPFFIVQSDVSAVECQWKDGEGRTVRVQTPDFGAVEFHGAKPWPGVMYMDPYAD